MNRLLRFGTIVWLTTLAATSAPAQTANEDNASIQALLSEVRQLRRAVEKTLSLSPRIQLLLQRAQLQDQRCDQDAGHARHGQVRALSLIHI